MTTESLHLKRKRKKINLESPSFTKINSKWIIDLYINTNCGTT